MVGIFVSFSSYLHNQAAHRAFPSSMATLLERGRKDYTCSTTIYWNDLVVVRKSNKAKTIVDESIENSLNEFHWKTSHLRIQLVPKDPNLRSANLMSSPKKGQDTSASNESEKKLSLSGGNIAREQEGGKVAQHGQRG